MDISKMKEVGEKLLGELAAEKAATEENVKLLDGAMKGIQIYFERLVAELAPVEAKVVPEPTSKKTEAKSKDKRNVTKG